MIEDNTAEIQGACIDCKRTIYTDEPFERVGTQQDARHPNAFTSIGKFRCGECSLKKRGLNITTKMSNDPAPKTSQDSRNIAE